MQVGVCLYMAAETVRQAVLLDYPLVCANPAFGAHDAGEPAATGASLFLPQQADGQGWNKSALAKAALFHRTPRAAATRLLQLGGAAADSRAARRHVEHPLGLLPDQGPGYTRARCHSSLTFLVTY